VTLSEATPGARVRTPAGRTAVIVAIDYELREVTVRWPSDAELARFQPQHLELDPGGGRESLKRPMLRTPQDPIWTKKSLREGIQMTDQERDERVIERLGFSRKIVQLATVAEQVWEQEQIASALMHAHLTYARGFMSSQDLAASLRQVADNLEASAPLIEPELRQ
jgi:hypothetical protein